MTKCVSFYVDEMPTNCEIIFQKTAETFPMNGADLPSQEIKCRVTITNESKKSLDSFLSFASQFTVSEKSHFEAFESA